MTLLEYITSLQDTGLSQEEIFAKAQEFKGRTKTKEVEVNETPVEEVKTNDVVGKKDATITSSLNASKAVEKITGQSKFGTGPSPSPDSNQSFGLVGKTAKQVSGVTPIFEGVDLNPGETKTANKFDFKYEISEDKQPIFYTKPEGKEDWIDVTANKAKNPGAELGVAEELGFDVGDFNRDKALKQIDVSSDFEVGDYLNVTEDQINNVSTFNPDDIKGETKNGDFLNTKELFFKNRAKSKFTPDDEFVDDSFEDKAIKKHQKRTLDSKLTDYIVTEDLNKSKRYVEFKDQPYTGKYKEDFREDAAISKVNYDYKSDLLKSINGFDYDDFLGYMNSKGYSNDYLDAIENPNQGYGIVQTSIRQNIDSEENPDTAKSLQGELKNSIINQQRSQERYLDLYIEEQEADYLKKLYSSYIKKNPEEFKDVESVDKALLKAKNYFDNKYGKNSYGLYNYNSIKEYKDLAFPELSISKIQDQAERDQTINKIKSQENLNGDLYLAAKKASRGYMGGAEEIAFGIKDLLGIDNTYGRSVKQERDISRETENVRYQFVTGKEAEVDGITYIKDEAGAIYDVTNKVILGTVSEDEFEKINKSLDESEKTGSSFSGMGSLQEFAGVAGRMAYDVIGTSLTGGASKALGITKLASAIRIPAASVGAMGYYGASGYFGTKQNTYDQFIEAGINSSDADEMSDLAARYGAAIYSITSVLSPNSKYVDNLNKNLFGTASSSSLIKNAIKGYSKKGVSGAGFNIFNSLKRLKPTKQGAVNVVADGVFEVAQEFTQQSIEVYGLNSYLNSIAGKDVLQQDMTMQDSINLAMTSFGSGSAFANLNFRGLGPRRAEQQLQSLYQISLDLDGSKEIMNQMVANGDVTQEQVSKVLSDVRAVNNQMSNIPNSVSSETQLESAIILQEIADLQNRKKNMDEAFHENIDIKIENKREALAEIVKPELEKSISRKGSKAKAAEMDVEFLPFGSQEEIDVKKAEIIAKGGKVIEDVGYGQSLEFKEDGVTKKVILINDQVSAEDNVYTSGKHETLHPFWEQALKGNPELAIKFGKSLMLEFLNNKEISGGAKFLSKFQSYVNDSKYSAEDTWSEVIPLMSEYLSSGDIQYNPKQEAWYKNIGKKISNFLKNPTNKQPLNLRFDTGKDVFDFIVAYNKSTDAGKGWSAAENKVRLEGAKGALVDDDLEVNNTYVVQEGETIEDVAEKFPDITLKQLKQLNKTGGQDLEAGTELIISAEKNLVSNIDLELNKQTKNKDSDGSAKASKRDTGSETVLDSINNLVPNTLKTKAEFDAWVQSERGGKVIADALKPGGAMSNYIKSRGTRQESDKMLDDVLFRVYNFNPEAKRKDDSVVGPEAFGEKIFADTAWAKVTARTKLFEEGEKRKLEKRQDDSTLQIVDPGTTNNKKPEPVKETPTKQTDATSFGPAKNKKQDLDNIVQVKDADRPNFKSLNNKYFNEVAENLFGIEGKKVRGNASLKYGGTKTDPTSSEANTLQNVFKNSENVRSFIKTMPEYNVATKETIINKQGESIDVSRDVYGRALGINPKVLEVFYDKVTRAIPDVSNPKGRSLGKTSQTQVYKLKPEFKGTIGKEAISKLQSLIGITPTGELSIPVKGPARTEFGSALTGLSKMYVDNVINTIGRSKLDSKQAKADLGAGKPKSMASKRIDTEAEMSPELKKLFKEVTQAKNINQALGIMKIGGVSINDSNRVEKQKSFQDAIEKFKLDLNTFLAGSFASSGAIRSRSNNGDVYYDLSNGEKILGTRVKTKDGKQKLNKDGKKMFNQPTLEAIEKKFGQGVTLVASRGRLYYGATDPAYIKAKLAAEKNTKDSKFKAVKNGLPPGIDTKITKEWLNKRAAQSEINMNVLDGVVTQLSEAVANGMPIEIAATIITQGYQATGGLIKIAAPFKYVSNNFLYALDGKKSDKTGKKYREEHNPPASVVGASIILAIKNNAAKPAMEAIRKNYYQTQLSKSDDTKIDQAELASTTVDGQSVFDNPISRLAAAGIDLQTLVNPLTGKTIAEESGFGIDPKVYNKYNANEKVQASSIQNEAILEGLKNPDLDVASEIKASLPLVPGKSMASKRDSDLIPDAIKYDRPITVQTAINALEKTDKALELARKLDQPVKKIRVFDFDDTLARTKSNVLYTMPDGTTGAIDAATFAKEAGNMEAEGAQWDFSEFSKVMQGSKGPLLDVAKIIADKRGTKDVFVLTARPADAAGPIKEFLASMGLDIPLANITGLGDGTPQAKAGWIMGKAAEGYNDFYFADDHTGNVKAVKDVLSQIDVKSKVQLAKASKRQTFDTVVNDMIEDSSGIETYKKYSAARAKTVGASKGKYNFLIPPSAEDFTGLLYKMIGKGKKGDAQMAFLKTNLLDTYNRAESAVTQAKVSAANDFVALKTKLKTLPKTLSKETGIGKFTYSHAVRVAAWTKQGMDIPGLSKRDIKELNDFVNKDAKLRVFTDELIKIQKGKEYPKPGKDWLGGNITTDIIGGINKVNRAEYQQEWRENIDIIFSEDNMNKMEAAYGSRWREAMEDSIRRMKSGSNRPIGGNRVTEGLLNWLNNSVGAVMFLNTRSALLQTISAVNFINLSDNNIVKAGVAFANQKQFWSDFMTLMNSDYLVERRNGLKINVSESEIADAVRESQNKPKAAIAFLLSKGFVMTRFADSFAIASGGSTFYRNRVNKYVKEGVEQSVAEKQAFADFKAIAEESQQSSSPSKISQQQASGAGRVILAWANTPMQYARIQKRAAQDLINGRGDWKTNVSKIVYYGAIQNLIFNTLQSAAFALGFGDDEEETDEAKSKKKEEKAYKVANGMIDSQLRGLGIFGTASVAVKNTLMTLYKEHNKKGSKYENAVEDLLSFSPPLGSKIGKITGGLRSASWNKKDMKEKGFSLDNPAYMAGAQVVTGLTNVPFDRVMKKINNVRGIVNERSALWQKVALGLGWSTWDVGLGYYGGFDKEKPLTPKQQLKLEVDTMKKDTNKPEQVKTLLDFGLTKKQIRELENENNRVKKILELQKKDKK